jgi:hypothetical protein
MYNSYMSKPDFSELVITHPIKDIMEGWFFKIDEVTNGYYLVEGMNIEGNVVSRMGSNPDELIEVCQKDIEEITK